MESIKKVLKNCLSLKYQVLQDENDRDIDFCEIERKIIHWNDYNYIQNFIDSKDTVINVDDMEDGSFVILSIGNEQFRYSKEQIKKLALIFKED